MSKKIVLTGGGTAGHVTPNLALLPGLYARGFEVRYIGSKSGMEQELIENAGVPYDGISTGKFRRYLSFKNVTDVGRVLKGLSEAKKLLKEYQPDVVFSKGGFVSVPVVRAAKKLHIPVIIHESDMTPGLANKLCYSAASKVCCNFPETVELLPEGKAVLSGSPIRAELLSGSREAGLAFAGLSGEKPVLLMIGGSSGARRLNEVLREALPRLLPDFDVIHLCGKGNLSDTLGKTPGYRQYEYISEELKDLFAAADIVFSRAGANAICELLALRKPNLLVPLSKAVSRGDQILNARSFEKQGYSVVIEEEELNAEVLSEALHTLYKERDKYIRRMEESSEKNGVDTILSLIDELTKTS
ncbi:MAG: undecaprenyldiphospho-muramoylpentapeptide beta-N-acetylglucosaminyltransferase [Lachnospiraceae bacterium]|nr:undecaprenyldiphospho-muramoylpentapeptide beta-N-acetylglucosaminyltransferase [Lachnospiraceae bacterium]